VENNKEKVFCKDCKFCHMPNIIEHYYCKHSANIDIVITPFKTFNNCKKIYYNTPTTHNSKDSGILNQYNDCPYYIKVTNFWSKLIRKLFW